MNNSLIILMIIVLVLGYIGYALYIVMRERKTVSPPPPEQTNQQPPEPIVIEKEHTYLISVSALTDGRIIDLVKTGICIGKLVIPRFVIQSIQELAGHPDILPQSLGEHALEIKDRLAKESPLPLEIEEADLPATLKPLDKEVMLAKQENMILVSADHNTTRVARLQGIRVLSIEEIAAGCQPHYVKGQPVKIRIVDRGKEPGQGIGYLADGTSVVVDGAETMIHQIVGAKIDNIYETVAGRMITAQLL
jgi:uncharacterized protein YacL